MSLLEMRRTRIADLLDRYLQIGADQEREVTAMRLLLTTLEPCSRHQVVPGHFTASAFVVAPDHQCALLIDHPTLGIWLQPGGHLEESDVSPLAGAAREVLEETGLEGVVFEEELFDIDIHSIPSRGAVPQHTHFDLRFLGVVRGLPSPAGLERLRAEWVPLADVASYTTDASVHRMATKYLRRNQLNG